MVRPGCSPNPPAFFRWLDRYSSPGESACWACLAERMKRNREVKAFLDRSPARRCRCLAPLHKHARTERHRACGHRDREGDRDRLPYRIARSHHQPRSFGLDHREALRRSPPAMPGVWPKEIARPAASCGAGRTCHRQQVAHDQRRLSDRLAAANACAFSQARKSPNRRRLASRAHRRRFASQHQLLCYA